MNTVSLTLIFQSTLTETNFCNVIKPPCGSGSERIRINLSDPNFSFVVLVTAISNQKRQKETENLSNKFVN